MGRERPDGEREPSASQRVRPDEVENVGDAEQGQEEEQTLQRFPEIKTMTVPQLWHSNFFQRA